MRPNVFWGSTACATIGLLRPKIAVAGSSNCLSHLSFSLSLLDIYPVLNWAKKPAPVTDHSAAQPGACQERQRLGPAGAPCEASSRRDSPEDVWLAAPEGGGVAQPQARGQAAGSLRSSRRRTPLRWSSSARPGPPAARVARSPDGSCSPQAPGPACSHLEPQSQPRSRSSPNSADSLASSVAVGSRRLSHTSLALLAPAR